MRKEKDWWTNFDTLERNIRTLDNVERSALFFLERNADRPESWTTRPGFSPISLDTDAIADIAGYTAWKQTKQRKRVMEPRFLREVSVYLSIKSILNVVIKIQIIQKVMKQKIPTTNNKTT